MSRLNLKFINKINVALSHSEFSPADFILEYPETGECYLKITFKYNSEYCFEVIEREEVESYTETDSFSQLLGNSIKRNDRVTNCYVYCSPGEFKVKDKISISNIGSSFERVNDWCSSIYSEITSNTSNSSLDSFREEVEKAFPCDDIENEQDVASVDEQVSLANKIDELYSKFEKMNEKANIAIDEMSSIKTKLETLKGSSKVMPKGIWHKVARSKIVDITAKFINTPEGKKLIISGVKKLFQLD